jgi:hypothetical protein
MRLALSGGFIFRNHLCRDRCSDCLVSLSDGWLVGWMDGWLAGWLGVVVGVVLVVDVAVVVNNDSRLT